jgi:hypothetical protein
MPLFVTIPVMHPSTITSSGDPCELCCCSGAMYTRMGEIVISSPVGGLPQSSSLYTPPVWKNIWSRKYASLQFNAPGSNKLCLTHFSTSLPWQESVYINRFLFSNLCSHCLYVLTRLVERYASVFERYASVGELSSM